MRIPQPALLGLAAAATTLAGLVAASTGDAPVTAAVRTAAAAPAAAPTASPAPGATPAGAPAPRPVDAWVRTVAANVWLKPSLVRRVDRPSFGVHPNFTAWVRDQSYAQRLALGSRLMTQVLRGEHVLVTGARGRWANVIVVDQRGSYYRQGIPGWVDRSQLSTTPVRAAAPVALARRGISIVAAARAFLGTPYIFGGMTRVGIDCSGLTFEAAQAVGLLLPRDAADQSRLGRSVPRSRLRPGDLVFFGRGSWSSIHHVGIYVGHGRVLHAPHTGSTVRVSPLSDFPDYWGARRLLPTG